MRDNISVIAGKIAILVLAGILSAQSAVLAAGPEPKKPAIKEAPAKSTKPAPPGSKAASGLEDVEFGDEFLIENGEGMIDTDLLESEGPNPARRPQNRVAAPVDLSKPVVEPSGSPVSFILTARLAPELAPLPNSLVWRVFGERPGPDGKLPLLTQFAGGPVEVRLSPGSYLVHAAYGRAGAIKRILVPANGGRDDFVINAGGIRLSALVGKDTPIPNNQLYFDVYVDDGNGGERTLVISRAQPKQILRLHAGTYYVVSHYGEANATVRAAIKVEAGKLTDATLFHKAGRVTLKLVSERGGEALANTAWSVQTPEGETLGESVGAYHQAILAAGQYQALARHDGKTFRANFAVESDVNRDVEVIAK